MYPLFSTDFSKAHLKYVLLAQRVTNKSMVNIANTGESLARVFLNR